MFVFVSFGLDSPSIEFSEVYGTYESEDAAIETIRSSFADLGVALPRTERVGSKLWLCEADGSKVGYATELRDSF